MKPESLSDIMASIALYRPGPMNSIGKYIENKRNRDKIDYKIDIIKPILEETFGCVVYQEQVMQIFRTIADYSFGQADIIRKAMSKKQAGKIEKERDTFLSKAKEKGIDYNSASELFEELVGFCKYAFNKSHAASYAVVTYRTAYLKCHYPKEYMASLLTSVIGDEDKIALYADDCRRMGIELLPPDINESYGYFNVVGDNIRFALLAMKNVGRTFVEDVINERRNGSFASFEEFVNRMREADLNKRQIESLIKGGCFDYTKVYRSQLMAVYEKIIDSVSENNRRNAVGQLDFFSVDAENGESRESSYKYPDIGEYSAKEKLIFEKECVGFYFSGNLLDNYTNHSRSLRSVSVKRIIDSFDKTDDDDVSYGTKEFSDRQKVWVCGVITKIVDKTTRKGDKMCFVTLEDKNDRIEVIVFSSVLEEYGYMLTTDNIVGIFGEISARGENEAKIIMQKSEVLKTNEVFGDYQEEKIASPISDKKQAEKTLYLKVPDMEGSEFKHALNLLEIFEGKTRVVFYDAQNKKYVAANGRSVELSEKVFGFFVSLLGKENVILK